MGEGIGQPTAVGQMDRQYSALLGVCRHSGGVLCNWASQALEGQGGPNAIIWTSYTSVYIWHKFVMSVMACPVFRPSYPSVGPNTQPHPSKYLLNMRC